VYDEGGAGVVAADSGWVVGFGGGCEEGKGRGRGGGGGGYIN
jgi:hypothetical protein